MALVVFTYEDAVVNIVAGGDPRSKAAINSFTFCSSVGSPKIYTATMNSSYDRFYITKLSRLTIVSREAKKKQQ